MSETATNPASRYGPIAAQEFEGAGDAHKPRLSEWLDALPDLSDEDFFWQAASAIHDSAQANSFRGNWEHDHCKATAAHSESERRHQAAGHAKDCTGDTIYSRAFAQVWREQGHSPSAYPSRPCGCGLDSR
jgi:hypothetical protein